MTESAVRRPHAEKDPSGGATGAILLQVERESLAHVGNEGEAVADQTLASNDELSFPPPQVAELERDDLACAKSQSGEEQEDGVIATTRGRRTTARPQ